MYLPFVFMSKYWTYCLRCCARPNIVLTVCVHVQILDLLSTLLCTSTYCTYRLCSCLNIGLTVYVVVHVHILYLPFVFMSKYWTYCLRLCACPNMSFSKSRNVMYTYLAISKLATFSQMYILLYKNI